MSLPLFFFLVFAHRTGVGYTGSRARYVSPCAGPGSGHLAAIFYSILSERQAGLAAQRARATECVLSPFMFLLLFLPLFSRFGTCGLVPPEVFELKGRRGELGKTDCESGYPKCSHMTDRF